MGIDALPMIAFLGAADKWLKAIEGRQTERASYLVSQLRVAAQLLAIDPEFKRIFQENSGSCSHRDPEQALSCVDAFFHSITDASRPGRFRDHNRANSKEPNGGMPT
jgi:hypothetical protein